MPAKQQDKQSFLATVSLLHASSGMLDILSIPSSVSPDWLVPKSLVLDVLPMSQHQVITQWEYEGVTHELPIYSLVTKNEAPEKLIVLESMNDLYRIALLISGEAQDHKVRISMVSDADDVIENDYCLQAVRLDSKHLYMVPDLDKLSHRLVDFD